MNNKNKTLQSLIQFIKYALIGGINVLIDFLILNILSFSTGITSGNMLFVFNALSFLIYSNCGYRLNRKFTFKNSATKNAYFQYASVLFFSMILNSFMLIALTNKNPLLSIMAKQIDIIKLNRLWLNISKLIASMSIGTVAFLVNKFFIFKKNK